MVGFGATFLIAKAQGKNVTVKVDDGTRTMLIALALSLSTTLIFLFVQKFRVRRPHAICLIALYIVFLFFAIITTEGLI